MAKDIRVSLADRAFTFTSIIIPVNYLFLFMIVQASRARGFRRCRDESRWSRVTTSPTGCDEFAILHRHPRTSRREAERRLHRGQRRRGNHAANLTRYRCARRAGRPVALPVQVNNLNVDYTDDIRIQEWT